MKRPFGVTVIAILLTPNVRQAFGKAPQQPAPMASPPPVEPPVPGDDGPQ